MYNRILKRPMFKRGGPSYQAQGTGITSGLDTPRRGLVQHPGGYAGDTREIIATEREEIFAPKPYENVNDIISSFGVYTNPKHDDGSYKTTGEMGWDQAQMIDKVRNERKEKQDLAELAALESREAKIIADEKFKSDMAITKAGVRPLDVDAKKQLIDQAKQMLEKAKIDYADTTKYPDGIPQHIKDEIEALNTLALGQNFWSEARAAEYAAKVYSTEEVLENMTANQIKAAIDALIAKLTGNRFVIAKAAGGRVNYAYGTPGEEAATVSETEMVPGGMIEASATEVATGNMNNNMEQGSGLGDGGEAFALLRARLPQEITDDIVSLIAYNPQAFEDFAQIESQEDVIAFNSKYGVELVIDAQQV